VIDHVGIPVRDVAASAAFYDAVLAPLGAKRIMEAGGGIGYGTSHPAFWIEPVGDRPDQEKHLAFTAADRAAVLAFHEAAVAGGAEVLHAPRVWPEYHPGYFAVFVRDPDGNNVEAVCHTPG
jgi:catechol 2,3-dioxygenase-like lactoylglutathione lyase family enzyme